MLKSEHLAYTVRSGRAYPRFVRPDRGLPWAEAVLGVIAEHHRLRRGELMEALHALEGDSPDYNLVRGLAHLALSEAEFALGTSLEPARLREEAFALAAQRGYGTPTTQGVLRELAERHALEASQIPALLYADLPENHLLVRLPDLTPAQLLDRYNLAQAQGLLYSATHLVLQVHRNEVGEYKKLFRYLKFYRLMFTVEGDLDSGYRIHVDGPASLFQATRRYGVRMAALLPALLHVTRWELTARLWLQGQAVEYALDWRAASQRLRSHYPRPPEFDSMLEATFIRRWEKLQTPWRLEREVEVVDLKGTVFLPDFALRHPDGRRVYLEIVGFWHPEYLRRKLEKVRAARMDHLILAVSRRLALSQEALSDLPGRVLWFKGQIQPEAVLEMLEPIPEG